MNHAMKPFALAAAILVISLGLLAGSFTEASRIPLFVPVSGLALAFIVYLSTRISTFLRVFVTMYGLGYLFIVIMNVLAEADILPKLLKDLLPPAFMATAAASFALVVFAVSHIPVIRTIMKIADPYFESRADARPTYGFLANIFPSEGAAARAMIGAIIAGNFVQVGLSIRLNIWYRDLFNAFEKRDFDAFLIQIWWVFVPLLVFWIIFQLIDLIIDSYFDIRWREWLTRENFTRWMGDGTHYRMMVTGNGADNPDQRIAMDVREFVSRTMALSIRLLTQAVSLVSFTVILWGISAGFTLPGTAMIIPGFLVWVALVYSIVGTLVTHWIGKPLIKLDFKQEQVEANFRFGLARLREYGEQIALLRGERNEQRRLGGMFDDIVSNFIAILKRKLKLIGFTFSWQQISVAFPYILIGPYYFAQKVTLGQMQQGASAFGRVEGAMSFFIASYQSLAAYKAVVDRLTTFREAMDASDSLQRGSGIALPSKPSRDLHIPALDLAIPSGDTIVRLRDVTLRAGETTLLTGPSGSGKSTLFRAVAGIWPYGDGEIGVPEGASVMLLPQRPYLPLGLLRDAIRYPGMGDLSDEQLRQALVAARLPKLVDRLDEEAFWSQVLSLGEQQRLAIARALVEKPDWLFLDEATAALDEPTEAAIYAMLKSELPDTTIVSIGHRSTLIPIHDRRIDLVAGDDGVFKVREMATA
jgi:putative ATP-binding cassette transporter